MTFSGGESSALSPSNTKDCVPHCSGALFLFVDIPFHQDGSRGSALSCEKHIRYLDCAIISLLADPATELERGCEAFVHTHFARIFTLFGSLKDFPTAII
jgi:hypothetical protein